jgi:hypothetical protein
MALSGASFVEALKQLACLCGLEESGQAPIRQQRAEPASLDRASYLTVCEIYCKLIKRNNVDPEVISNLEYWIDENIDRLG